jgi:hypothetical protein
MLRRQGWHRDVIELGCSGLLQRRSDVAVSIEGYLNRGMSQSFLDDLGMDALFQ